MVRKKTVRKGETKAVINNFGTGIPRTFQVSIQPVKDSDTLSGTYEEQRHFWIFPDKVSRGKLSNEMTFQRQWINAIYRLKITPNCDVEVTIR